MRKFLPAVLLVAFLFPVLAYSQTGLKWNEDQLTWVAPTTCSDGSPIAECPVTGYRLETAKTCTATTWTLAGTTAANVLTLKVTGVTAGLNCYRVKATSAGGDSGPSPTASTTAVPPVPAPPPSLTVTDLVAWEVRENSRGVMVASRIGIVPRGTVCSQETRTANGVTYNRIATSPDLINWPKVIPPADVFARCS